MTPAIGLVLGLGLGLRHATDVDHLIAIATLVEHERGTKDAARVAALWGLGHSSTFLAIGIAIIALGVRLPATFERVGEGLVGVMLIALCAMQLRARRPGGAGVRPIAVGLVHGLGGSAGVVLLALATFDRRDAALAYLACFCVGTVAGMVLLTLFLARSFRWSRERGGRVGRAFVRSAALFGAIFGALLLYRAAVAPR
ncbi:MAG: hypothetical protein ACXVEF_34155 [Polyangiales bacterium]